MENKNFAIITSADSNCGDFLVKHWIKSILDNVNKNEVDIIVLDYGLNDIQKNQIDANKVKIIKCKKEGHIVNIRYKDILNFLKNHHYKQILSCDGGDIIFQKDITEVFLKDKENFRGVCEDLKPPMLVYSILMKTFSNEFANELTRFLRDKKTINGGFIIAPYEKFIKLCLEMDKNIINKNAFGPDQVVLNYLLYKEGFIELDRTYNFIPNTANEEFDINEGIFYRKNKEKIAVVHNAGNISMFRPIKNFGYGKGYNNFSYLTYHLVRILFKMSLFINK